MNRPKFLNNKKANKRIVSMALVVVMLFNTMPINEMVEEFSVFNSFDSTISARAEDVSPYSFSNGVDEYAAYRTETTGDYDYIYRITINSADDFKRFSWWYYSYSSDNKVKKAYFELSMGLQGAVFYDLYDKENNDVTYSYKSIGTSTAPFNGKMEITTSVVNQFYSPVPLFEYIDQRSVISDGTSGYSTLIFYCSEDTTTTPATVFTKNVVNPTNSNTPLICNISLENYTGEGDFNEKATSGIFGVIGDADHKASVQLNLTNNATGSNVHSADDVGLLCGKLNAGSVLNVTLNDGTNNNYTVTSTGGKAGGLVGSMYADSQLILSGTGLNDVTNSVSSSTSYAGGIVGYAEDAYIGTAAVVGSDYSTITIRDPLKTTKTTVTGESGSGYVFGYYKNTLASRKFDISLTSPIIADMTTSNAGGVFGVLRNEGSELIIDGNKTINNASTDNDAELIVTLSTESLINRGGMIGSYSTNSLSNTLEVKNSAVKVTGGVKTDSFGTIIGCINDTGGNSAAYVKISNIYAKRTNNDNYGGGLVGRAGNTNAKGSFIDVSGYIKINGKFSAGLVKEMLYGVLRIEGITDLGGLGDSSNYILTTRGNALVYSRGTGNQSGTATNEWRIIRHGHASNDISTWGEVLRLNNSALNGTQLIDETNTYTSTHTDYHTVTLKPAPSGSISTLTDFVLLALNIQLNTASTAASLKTSGSNSTTLLGSEITLAANTTFDLSGTGMTGLTRDCSGDYQSGIFTSSITGGTGTKIVLAIGEAYGVNSSGTALANGTAGSGVIYGHQFCGLLARTQNAVFTSFTVSGKNDGTTDRSQRIVASSGIYFGGVSAQSKGGDSFSDVSSEVELYASRSGDNRFMAGGFIGRTATDASGEVTFENCATTAVFHDNTQNADDKPESHFGGYIGVVDASGGANASVNNSLTVSFGTDGGTNACSVGGSYTTESTTAPLNAIYGGLVGTVRGNNSHAIFKTADSAFRSINVYSVSVDGLSISSKTNTASGGLLGYAWHDAEVNLQNVTVGGSSANTVAITAGTGTKLAGLVYNATGHWSVGNVSIDNVTFNASNANSSLGLLVNSTVNECRLNIDNTTGYGYAQDKKAGLLLEILDQSNYSLEGTTALTIDSKITTFDEIAAFSKNPDPEIDDIAANGNSVISINTDGSGTAVTMTGLGCNTYQNQTAYGKNTGKYNANTRYYYNLDTIRKKASPNAAEQLMLWSLSQYAHGPAVKNYFNGTTSGTAVSSISGELDMNGYSYYPVDYSTLSLGTITKLKFYNSKIESGESDTGNTDSIVRSTTDTTNQSQHYMMHCGLFRNVSSSLTIPDITIEGNVGLLPNGSGFIVCGTVGGESTVTTVGNGTSNTITLKGAHVRGANNATYAPLLINCIDSNSTLNINGVKSEEYKGFGASDYAATSLIGKAGEYGGNDVNIKLNFSKITLDSRKQDIPSADNARFSDVYGSSKSIFSRATLLEQYCYTDTSSVGTYNYTSTEDWGLDTNGKPKHNVTYGQEIIGTLDHIEDGKSQQNSYYGEATYTDPTTGTNTTGQYANFTSTYFLPYVANIGDAGDNYKELNINISSTSLTVGCGTYNDPYVVNAKMLNTVANILNGSKPDKSFYVRLPNDLKNYSDSGDVNLKWCTGDDFHDDYHLPSGDSADFDNSYVDDEDVTQPSTASISYTNVQKYLAGAYYVIEGDITLPSGFAGLGGTTASTAFRGVIVGKEIKETQTQINADTGLEEEVEVGTGKYPTVTLNGTAPFIATSNGSVVKDLNFVVSDTVTFNANQETATATFNYGSGCASYGVVMGKIMGGDNIIDAVGVEFNGTVTAGANNSHIVPVGGYVGVVVNGGLFFRNMDKTYISSITGMANSGEFAEDARTHLYWNPIIGRVINGYAVTEADSYVPSAASQTMKNGTKNYAITDIDKTASVGGTNTDKVLDVTASEIKVPDAQAWFIMSCIVNSGTGSGSNSSYQMANDNISYSVANYKPTHIGSYADVGDKTKTTSTVCDSLLFKTNSDAYVEMGNKAAVTPYIIEKYTKQNGTGTNDFYKHYAKSLSGSARSITLNPDYANENSDNYEVAAKWTLPDSYRGIGNLHNTNYNITISGMTCNNTTINLNMKYQTYLYSATNKIYQENYYPISNKQNNVEFDMGFGLFNTFKPYTTADITISDLNLKGNVYIDTLDKDTGLPRDVYGSPNGWKAYDKSSDDIRNNGNGRVSAGMFAGVKYYNSKQLILSNIALNGINVHSSRCSGGMIGMAAAVTINACPATNVTVLGKWDTGGYIGKATNTAVTISGTGVSDKTSVTINSITNEALGHNYENNKRQCGVGGLVGKSEIAVTISNISISKYGSNGYVEKSLQGQDENGVGGFVGLCSSGNLTINNCSLTGISVVGKGANVGGVLGGLPGGSLIINNISLDGTGAVEGISVTNRISVGGIVGKVNGDVTITGAQLKNYTIQKTELAAAHEDTAPNDNKNVGGCIGLLHGDKTIKLKDFLISDCVFKSPEAGRMSAIIGYMKNGKLQGYNVAENNISLASGVDLSWYTGDIFGAADNSTSREIKIVGFSRQSTPTNVLYPNIPKSTSYLIFSDYLGTGFDGSNNKDKPKLNGPDAVMVSTGVPYATVNPSLTLFNTEGHETILTGDGIASTKAGSPIESIVTDIIGKTSLKRYTRSDAAYKTFTGQTANSGATPLATSYYSSNLSTFNTEWADANLSQDFVVLNLEDTNKNNATDMINSYINLLCNTNGYNFADNSSTYSGIYTVDIYKMSLTDSDSDGTYDRFTATLSDKTATESAQAANLKWDTTNKKFYMTNSSSDTAEVDSEGNAVPTFTLIDVAFKDPTAASVNAYHLYIPIYVKKLMKFEFTIKTATNTPYYTDAYAAADHMDNLGSPGSVYFTYTYERTKKEWQDALNYGENFLTSYDKILNMVKKGTTTIDFDNNTLVALVDSNNKDIVYYARFSDVHQNGAVQPSNGTLTLYNSSAATKSYFNTHIDGSGTAFSPVTINDLLDITPSSNNTSGKFVKMVLSNEGESIAYATVKIGDDYYRPIDSNPEVATADSTQYSSARYDLTVNNIKGGTGNPSDDTALNLSESYYLSFFTISSGDNARREADVAGGYVVTENESESVYTIDDVHYKVYDPSTDSAKPRYKIIETVNYYNLTSPSKLTGGSAPAKAATTPEARDILFGNLFIQSDVKVTADYNGTNPDLITSTNNTVKVKLETTVKLTDYALSQLGAVINNDSPIYQSFLVYMTKHNGGSSVKAIMGEPTANASYQIESVNSGTVATSSGGDQNSNAGSNYANVGNNYIEVASKQKISNYLKNGGGAKITSYVHITYDDDGISSQFPGRTNDTDLTKYADVTAASNIGFDPENTDLSKNQRAAVVQSPIRQYYIMSADKPTLNYNAFADSEGNAYGQLGINANDLDGDSDIVDVKTEAIYDVSPISDDVKDCNWVKLTFVLSQKEQGSYKNYQTDKKQISTYLYQVHIDKTFADTSYAQPKEQITTNVEGVDTYSYEDASTTAKAYTFIMPRSVLATNGDNDLLTIPIDFGVYTGKTFEDKGLMYSNYMIEISAEMIETENDAYPTGETPVLGSDASNYIIYTNAKLIGEYIPYTP